MVPTSSPAPVHPPFSTLNIFFLNLCTLLRCISVPPFLPQSAANLESGNILGNSSAEQSKIADDQMETHSNAQNYSIEADLSEVDGTFSFQFPRFPPDFSLLV